MKKLLLNPVIATYFAFSTSVSFSISFIFATYSLFLVDKGMNLWQINVVNSFFVGFVILAEMPTGSFADNFGRHRSMVISCFLLSASTLCYFLSSSFWFFVLAEIIAAFGHTFSSGAAEAWLVDSLQSRNEKHLQKDVFHYGPFISTFGVISGVILGSYLGSFDLSFPWLASSILMLIVGIFSLFIKENYHQKKVCKKNFLSSQLIEAWKSGIKNKNLLYIMSFGFLVALCVQALNMQWPILFKNDYNFSSLELGYLFACISIFSALGARLAKKIRLRNEKTSIVLSQLITAIAIIFCSQLELKLSVLAFFLLHELGRGIAQPLRRDFINNNIESGNRATLLSLDSMFLKSGGLVGLIISGFLAEATSIRSTWFIFGITLIMGIIIFLAKNQKRKTLLKK